MLQCPVTSVPRNVLNPRLSPVGRKEQETEEREQGSKHVKDAALLRHVAVRKEVAKGQKDEADEEVCDPYAVHVSMRTRPAGNGMGLQFRDSPTEDNAETAY